MKLFKKTESSETNLNEKTKKTFMIILSVLIAIILFIFVFITISNNVKNSNCEKLEKLIKDETLEYVDVNKINLTLINPTFTININDLIDENYIKEEDVTIDDQRATGKIKVTKVEDEFIVTLDLNNCAYCSTDERYSSEWSDLQDEKPEESIVDVIVLYNYVDKETHFTSWTNYYSPSQLEKNPMDDYTNDRFDQISPDAKNVQILSEEKVYYRHRDKRWMWYENANNNYSGFYSEQPAGYAFKDEETEIVSEYSDWSTNYPEEKDYRRIETKTGYRWYIEKDGERVYYDNGAYLPEEPSDEYQKDRENKATIYRYRDYLWRWYNGEERNYTGYSSVAKYDYIYKDEELWKYSSYSSYSEESELTNENIHYREEETEVRLKFRLQFDIYSYNLMENSLLKEDFEEKTSMTLQEVNDSEKYGLVTEYKYVYKSEI